MELKREVHFKSRVSLVVNLLDSLTSEAPIGKISIQLEGIRSQALSKSNGSYIFSDLPAGEYRLRVDAEHYFQEYIPISTHSSRIFEHILLKPLPSYPFSQGTSLIRACLRDSGNTPVKETQVVATLVSEECARARLLPDKTEKGADEIALGSVIGRIAAGSRFVLKGRGAKEKEELICIAEVLEHQKRVRLHKPLTQSFIRGAMLLPVIQTNCTDRGELVVAIGGCRASTFAVNLDLTHKDGSTRSLLKEVMVSEGATTNLGTQYVD